MKSLQGRRRLAVIPAVSLAGAVLGASGIAYFAGQALAYLSLVFGILFFAFAARYYVATASVLLIPGEERVDADPKRNGRDDQPDLESAPMISVHLAMYNEERVAERLLDACSKLDYPNYEVVVVDDSTDGTVTVLRKWILEQMKDGKPKMKITHRDDRRGFKGGALNDALTKTDPAAEFVVVFDADFVPPPDILRKFLAYFNGKETNGAQVPTGKIAAVQGYQWHTLNRSENWLTRGVSCDFSGNYMVDRTFQEVTGVMKMVAGSVYMIRADVLRELGWSTSITEDWELTLRLYEGGYKVLYTPLVQAPAECPSTLGKLVRQRMRWAEGHTYNVKRHFFPILTSGKISLREKFEFLYYAPYYLQSAFLILGTFFWLTSDVVLGARLPFWTTTVGWGLVLTNLLALPVMSLTGLFLEKRARKDFPGIVSQLALIYALSPYQAYAALKGLLEPKEGSWVRTFKSGNLSGFPGKLEPRKVVKKVLPPKRKLPGVPSGIAPALVLAAGILLLTAAVQGQFASSQIARPAYYFFDQPAPPGFVPFPSTPPGVSFQMHIPTPTGNEVTLPIGISQGSGPVFFSDPSPTNLTLPFGASVSIHVWVNGTDSASGKAGNLKFRIDIYNPSNNTIRHLEGAGETQVFALQPGVNFYQASWGHIARDKLILKGETIMATIWCPDCAQPPTLLFNSPGRPSNIDFPIEVPENSVSYIVAAAAIPSLAAIAVEGGAFIGNREPEDEEGGLRRVERYLIVTAVVVLLTLPLVITFNDILASAISVLRLQGAVSFFVPYEASAASALLSGLGFHAGNSASEVWLGGGFIPVVASIDWNCAGWQSFVLLGITSVAGIGDVRGRPNKLLVVVLGVGGVFAVNVIRISTVVLMGYFVGYPAALVFHDYGGTLLTLGWLLLFWTMMLKRYGYKEDGPQVGGRQAA